MLAAELLEQILKLIYYSVALLSPRGAHKLCFLASAPKPRWRVPVLEAKVWAWASNMQEPKDRSRAGLSGRGSEIDLRDGSLGIPFRLELQVLSEVLRH